MKTLDEISVARSVIIGKLIKPMLHEQRILLQGMLCALCWVAETPDGTTLERLVMGEPLWQEVVEGN